MAKVYFFYPKLKKVLSFLGFLTVGFFVPIPIFLYLTGMVNNGFAIYRDKKIKAGQMLKNIDKPYC
ncbi:MAG: hypothetical protein CMH78_05955 [Nitrospinae bacterium]|nr:hypothetical protein [Nitrospinota bacterium]